MPNTLAAYLARHFARRNRPRPSTRKSKYFKQQGKTHGHGEDQERHSSSSDDSQADMFAVRLLRRSAPCSPVASKWYRPRHRSTISPRLQFRSAPFLRSRPSRRKPVLHPRHSWPLVSQRASRARIAKQTSLFRSVLSTSLRLSRLRRKTSTMAESHNTTLSTTRPMSMSRSTIRPAPARPARGLLRGHKKSFSESIVRSLSRSRTQVQRPARLSISAPILPARAQSTGRNISLESLPAVAHLAFTNPYSSNPLVGRETVVARARQSVLASLSAVSALPVLKPQTATFAAIIDTHRVEVDSAQQITKNDRHVQAVPLMQIRYPSFDAPAVGSRRVTVPDNGESASEDDVTLYAQTISSSYTATPNSSCLLPGEDKIGFGSDRWTNFVEHTPRPLQPDIFTSAAPSNEQASLCTLLPNDDFTQASLSPLHSVRRRDSTPSDLQCEEELELDWETSCEYLCATEEILRECYGVL